MSFHNLGIVRCAAAGLAALLSVGSGASAATVIFDDAMGDGWTRNSQAATQSTSVYEGTAALQTSNGNFVFDHAGFTSSSDYVLEFYANTSDATPTASLRVQLTWVGNDAVSFDNRNIPAVYVIDGVEVLAGTSNKGIALDTDPNTWQKVQLDLSQVVYEGFPPVAHQYVPGVDVITRIVIGSDAGQSLNLLVDSVRLVAVPEPASLSALGLGLGALLLRRRR